MRWKTRGDGETADGRAAAAESGASRDRRSLRDGLGMERRGDAPAAGTRAVEVEAAAGSELRVLTHDGHMGRCGAVARTQAGSASETDTVGSDALLCVARLGSACVVSCRAVGVGRGFYEQKPEEMGWASVQPKPTETVQLLSIRLVILGRFHTAASLRPPVLAVPPQSPAAGAASSRLHLFQRPSSQVMSSYFVGLATPAQRRCRWCAAEEQPPDQKRTRARAQR